MGDYLKKLDELKIKLFRLHFLLTEEQTEQIRLDGIGQFKICFEGAMDCLRVFIQDEFKQKSKSYTQTLESAMECRLFNQQMTSSMQQMLTDYNLAHKGKNLDHVYLGLQEKYAGYLQMIFDMLTHMGEDAEEE